MKMKVTTTVEIKTFGDKNQYCENLNDICDYCRFLNINTGDWCDLFDKPLKEGDEEFLSTSEEGVSIKMVKRCNKCFACQRGVVE